MEDFMKRTKTLVAEILSLVCELVVVGFSGYMGYLFLLIWSLSGASAEAISILILMLVMVLMVLVGIVDFIMSCVSFGAVSCNEESYQKKRKLLTTSSIFKLVLGAGSVIFGCLNFGGKDNLFVPITFISSGLVLIVCGVLVLVDMKQERKRVSNNQTNLVETEPKVELNKQ